MCHSSSSASNVVSLSGGKDSTAMLLMMLERGEPIADIIFFDTGWEFPHMYGHLAQLEKYIGRTITILHPRLDPTFVTEKSPFDFMFSEYPVRKRGTGEIHMIGRGWASMSRRWCTGRKQEAIGAYVTGLSYRKDIGLPLVQCIGFAADEEHRAQGVTKQANKYAQPRYPLIDWNITEKQALDYCFQHGFHWGGLYEHFDRVSCFCCPLQSLNDLRILRKYFRPRWNRMLEMESWLPEGKSRRFRDRFTVGDMEKRFAAEDEHEARMLVLPGMDAQRLARKDAVFHEMRETFSRTVHGDE